MLRHNDITTTLHATWVDLLLVGNGWKMLTWLPALTWRSIERHIAHFQYTSKPYFFGCPTSKHWISRQIFDVFSTSQAMQNFGRPHWHWETSHRASVCRIKTSQKTLFSYSECKQILFYEVYNMCNSASCFFKIVSIQQSTISIVGKTIFCELLDVFWRLILSKNYGNA